MRMNSKIALMYMAIASTTFAQQVNIEVPINVLSNVPIEIISKHRDINRFDLYYVANNIEKIIAEDIVLGDSIYKDIFNVDNLDSKKFSLIAKNVEFGETIGDRNITIDIYDTYLVGETIEYKYTFTDSTGCTVQNVEWENNQPSFNTTGKQVVKLRVQDDCGIWSEWIEKTITISDGGNGTISNPYIITNAQQLNAIRGGITSGWDTTKHYKIAKDIDLSSYSNWEPIVGFSGSLDGNNKIIRNMKITNKTGYVGLFADSSGNLTNIKLHDLSINTNDASYIGGLVAYNKGNVIGCKVTGDIVANSNQVGGIVGFSSTSNNGSIRNCKSYVNISGTKYNTGGIVGRSDYTPISECYYNGNITSNYGSSVGGIVGLLTSNFVTTSKVEGNIKGQYSTGGIVGTIFGVSSGSGIGVLNCYSTGTVSGNSREASGIVGNIHGSSVKSLNMVKNNYSNMRIEADHFVGGIVGRGSNSTTDDFVLERNVYLGSTIKSKTSTNNGGRVMGGTNNSKMKIGNNYGLSCNLINCPSITSGLNNKHGLTISSAQAKTESFYRDTLGWNFSSIWEIEEGKGYPTLQWEKQGY